MAFCPKCGKVVKEIEKFCADCGENLKEFLEDIEEEAEEKVKKTSYKGLVLFILFLGIFIASSTSNDKLYKKSNK